MSAIATNIDRLTNRLPTDLVGRTRCLFLVLGLLTAVMVVPPLMFIRPEAVGLHLLALALLALLCWRWFSWFTRGEFAVYDSVIEVVALTTLTWALSNPTIGLGVFYVGLYYRSLFGNRRQAILGVATFTASFFVGVALHFDATSTLLSSTTLTQIPGFVLTGTVMYVIGQTLKTHRETMDQLGVAEQQFRALIEQLPVGVYQAQLDGRITYVSPRAVSIFGFDENSIRDDVDWAIHTLIHPDDRESVTAARDHNADGAGQTDVEFRMMDARNEQRWVRVRSTLVRGVNGNPSYWQGTIEDVTGRKQAEADTHAAEERYRTLVEQLPAVTYVSAHDGSGTPNYVSPQIEQMLGFPANEWVSTPSLWIDRLHPEDKERVVAAVRDAVDSQHYSLEYRTIARDGRVVWVENIATLVRDVDSVPRYWHGVLLDATARKEAEAALHRSEERFRALIQNVSDTIAIHEPNGTVRYISTTVEELSGYSPDEIEHTRQIDWIHPDDRDRYLDFLRRTAEVTDEMPMVEFRYQHGDGSQRVMEMIGNNQMANPAIEGLVVTSREITERIQAESLQRQLASIVTSSHDAIIGTAVDGTITSWNYGAEALLGYQAAEMVGNPIVGVIPPEHLDNFPIMIRRLRHGESITDLETVGVTKSNERVDVSLTLSPLLDDLGKLIGISAIARDIRERKILEAELTHQAFHDSLTGLANRALFNDRLAHAVTRNARQGRMLAVLFMDLDNFKVINDSMGHEAGDRLLIGVSHRMTKSLRPGDTAARLGGDEFTYLLEDLKHPQEAVEVAQRLLQALQSPIAVDDQELLVSASIGIAVAMDDNTTPDDLLRHADVAMYHAKHQGKNRVDQYQPELEVQAWTRLRLEQDLRRALDREEFLLVYQPIMRLSADQVFAVEALVRWQHPEQGRISPENFIPLAEETGLILPLGKWVLETACRQMRQWQDTLQDRAPRIISVNLSVRQMQDPNLVQTVADILDKSGINPASLALEITESALMDTEALSVIQSLRQLGVRLGIDDFGTGYSSLAYLQRLPVDFVKIDHSFIDGLGRDANDTVITSGIIGLAHALNLRVIAEGVELSDQLERLRTLGCDFAQGFYLAQPMQRSDLDQLMVTTNFCMDNGQFAESRDSANASRQNASDSLLSHESVDGAMGDDSD